MTRYTSIIVAFFLYTSLIIGSGALADTQLVNVAFQIPLTLRLELDKYKLDAGDAQMYDEMWTPIGESGSFKLFLQNNSGSNWDLTTKMPDDLRRAEGVSDINKDIIKTSDVFWTIVYAGYYDNEMGSGQQVDQKQAGGEFPGLLSLLLAKGRVASDGKDAAGIPFKKIDDTIFSSSAFYAYHSGALLGKSYKVQLAFKFILVPPVTTTAGDYNGSIVFTLRTQ